MDNINRDDEIFSKVLTVGPSMNTLGGMASVLKIYRDYIPGFRHIATNSPHGTLAGIPAMLHTMLRLPIERLRGRKILHVHSASGKSFIRKSIVMAEARLFGYKVIFHSHSGIVLRFYGNFGVNRVKRILSMASSIIALSQSWVDYYRSTFGFNNVELLYNPITLPASVEQPRSSNPLQLIFLGIINDLKGIFDLIEVMAENKDRWRGRVHLTIGGSGEDERLKQRIETLGISDIVSFIGWTVGEDKEAALANAHVLLLPSYTEGLPMSILEGMIRCKPIISTPVGGIPEVVTPDVNGFLVAPGDKKALATAIDCYLLNPELIQRHGKVSSERSVTFRPDSILPRLAQIYRKVLDTK
ncbi:MAG: glycosyltransferase family 4 protein [Bacteroidales bacterium]|nr:glycosyltransferase family 4 protein [Bacteroidales bacterium]